MNPFSNANVYVERGFMVMKFIHNEYRNRLRKHNRGLFIRFSIESAIRTGMLLKGLNGQKKNDIFEEWIQKNGFLMNTAYIIYI